MEINWLKAVHLWQQRYCGRSLDIPFFAQRFLNVGLSCLFALATLVQSL